MWHKFTKTQQLYVGPYPAHHFVMPNETDDIDPVPWVQQITDLEVIIDIELKSSTEAIAAASKARWMLQSLCKRSPCKSFFPHSLP